MNEKLDAMVRAFLKPDAKPQPFFKVLANADAAADYAQAWREHNARLRHITMPRGASN